KEEAALALAEMNRFVDAKPTLLDLAKEPSERGRMAKAYRKVNELTEDINRKPPSAVKYDFKQLEEAIDLLKTNYWDESKIDEKKLVEAAVRGLCSSLDPYTVYMDEAAIKELIFSGPAYRNGLRSGDTITEVENESTVNRDLSELVRKLSGKMATQVHFKVLRRGW